MKYQIKKTEILAGSVQVDEVAGTSTFQANITFEILPDDATVIPDAYKTPTLTYFDLVFNTLDMATVLTEKDAKGLAKLKEVYGDSNVIA